MSSPATNLWERPEEFWALIGRLCDGNVELDERNHLDACLKQSETARRMFVTYLEVHAELQWRHRGRDASAPVAPDTELAPPAANSPVLQRMTRGLRSTATLSLWMTLLVAVAVYGTFGLVVWQMSRDQVASLDDALNSAVVLRPGAAQAVATLTKATECQWGPSTESIHEGTALHPQRLSLTSGVAQLTFGDGACVSIEGPCEFDLIAAGRGFLHSGKLLAFVSPPAVGFAINTPTAEIVDLGTEFAVEVDDQENSEVHVFTGVVVTRSAKSRPVSDRGLRVTAGHAVRIARQQVEPVAVPFNRTQYARLSAESSRQPLIAAVIVNNQKSYSVVPRGFVEGAIAYIDREAHRWYSMNAHGLPQELLGAHYVRTSNRDKGDSGLEIKIAISQAAYMYVLFDQRLTVPAWLNRDFTRTEHVVGMCPDADITAPTNPARVFPCSVWKRPVSPGEYTIGPNGSNLQGKSHLAAMYGIAVVPTIDRP
jgi:hypothetical protein